MKRGKEGKICGADDGDDNDEDDNNGENDNQKINSKSTFCPIPEQKRHRNLFHMHPGNKADGRRLSSIVILDILGGWDHLACT